MVCLTLFAAAIFVVAMLPSVPLISRIVCGVFLFACLAITIRTHRRALAAIRSPTIWRCTKIGAEVGGIVLVIMLAALWIAPPEMKPDFARWETIAAMSEAKRFGPNPLGLVALPRDLSGSTWDGNFYVGRVPQGRVYFFETVAVRVRPQNFRGYLYSTLPLDKLPMVKSSGGEDWIDGNKIDWGQQRNLVMLVLAEGFFPKMAAGNHWIRISNWPGDATD